jgi:arsenate reductase (thioredoxin)
MKYVLFVCTHNAGRSQMAQAFFQRDCTHPNCGAESAGSQPGRQVWPEAVQVMREVGIDLSGNKPKRLTVEMQLHADWAVTMGCGDVCPYVPTRVDDWDIPDPAGKSLEEVREIRDLIEERVKELVQGHIDEIQSEERSRLMPALRPSRPTRGLTHDAGNRALLRRQHSAADLPPGRPGSSGQSDRAGSGEGFTDAVQRRHDADLLSTTRAALFQRRSDQGQRRALRARAGPEDSMAGRLVHQRVRQGRRGLRQREGKHDLRDKYR